MTSNSPSNLMGHERDTGISRKTCSIARASRPAASQLATIAAALARAQAQLVNPEKSLVGTIRSDPPTGAAERCFRYAPLSSGLDIVRKTLGQHDIATSKLHHEHRNKNCTLALLNTRMSGGAPLRV
jgi:hypothetical protein